jgi:hypothetical protein
MLSSIRFFTIAALMGAVGFGAACARDATGPTEIEPALLNLPIVGALPIVGGLLQCTPQLVTSRSASIGPAGGEIKVGNHKFTVPRGALSKPTVITMQAPTGKVRSVRFLPEGLTFNAGSLPRLKLDYGKCEKPKSPVKIAFTTENLQILEVLPSVPDSTTSSVDAPIKHFSRYAISY